MCAYALPPKTRREEDVIKNVNKVLSKERRPVPLAELFRCFSGLQFAELKEVVCKNPNNFECFEDGELFVKQITKVSICATHCSKNKTCPGTIPFCSGLHICKFYLLSGKCPYGGECAFGHDLTISHNMKILKENYLDGLPIDDLKFLFGQAESRNSVTAPKICKFYNVEGGCRYIQSGKPCPNLHICKHYIFGRCRRGKNCRRSHNILDHSLKDLLEKHGISTRRTPKEIIADLREAISNAGSDGSSVGSSPIHINLAGMSIHSASNDGHSSSEDSDGTSMFQPGGRKGLDVSEMETNDLDLDLLTRQQYEKAIKDGREEDKTIRLMIIGCYGQGKTTLARRLLALDLEGIESTNGINIHNVACKDRNVWENLQEEDDNYEAMKRLALVRVVENEQSPSSIDENQTEIIYSRIALLASDETEEMLSSDFKSSASYGSEHENLTFSSQNDLKLFQKLKQELNLNENEKTQKISLWDFGGQFVFYATHQLFHSRHAVYLLVFDLSRHIDSPVTDEDYPGGIHPVAKSMKDYIEFWITSVHSYVSSRDATKPLIILVGTHKDKLKDESDAEEYFENIRQMFDCRKLGNHIYPECFAIAGTDLEDDEVNRLRQTVLTVGSLNKQVIPASWIRLELELRQQQSKNIIQLEDVIQTDIRLGRLLGRMDRIKSFLKFHHARGTIIYFDEGELANRVILNPVFIVDAFKCIITSCRFCRTDRNLRPLWQKLTRDAILMPDLIQAVWKTNDKDHFIMYRDVLIAILQRHKIISEALQFDENSGNLSKLGYYIVPSFLRKPRHGEIEAFLEGRNCCCVSLVYVFDNEAVVPTVFQRITGAAVGTWSLVDYQGNSLLFENAGIYRLKMSYAGAIVMTQNKIELLVIHMCPGQKVSAEIPDFLRRFVENVIKNEFRKLNNSHDHEDKQTFNIAVRCQHSIHSSNGSNATYDLGMLERQSEKVVCCPDNVVHEGIDTENILHEWFGYKIVDKVVPKRTLSQQEYVMLASAIGYDWKQLGLLLGVDKVAIQHVEMDNSRTSMRIYEMLQKWEEQMQDEATLDILVQAINKLPPTNVNFDIVKNLIDGIC